ncbi:PhlD [Streptomyces sp. FXJ1.4098]|nr:PhlD [Streptomyces sp. FXJ1.4098]
MAFVSRPAIALPEYKVTTEEIISNIREVNPDLPGLERYLRNVRGTTVDYRYFVRPLEDPTISGNAMLGERNRAARAGAIELGVRAAREALQDTGLKPGDIDCLVSSHTTSWALPGIDVALVEQLGLRPDVRRIPMGTLGCVGGAHALAKAHDYLRAYQDHRVLVVVPEIQSTSYNPGDTGPDHLIFKALLGDAAGACVVTGVPIQPGIQIDSTYEYILPGSTELYRGWEDEIGRHFGSKHSGIKKALGKIMPNVRQYLASNRIGIPEFAILHHGGPMILRIVAEELGIDQDPEQEPCERVARHSWKSLETSNKNGAGIMEILNLTHQTPPPEGARGVVLALGPGFAVAACAATWHS